MADQPVQAFVIDSNENLGKFYTILEYISKLLPLSMNISFYFEESQALPALNKSPLTNFLCEYLNFL